MKTVLVELVVAAGLSGGAVLDDAQQRLPGVVIDRTYNPVPMAAAPQGREITPMQQVVIIRAKIEESTEDQLKALPGVIGVWSDARVEPFEAGNGSF